MHIHIALDDLPEFDTLNSMFMGLRGMAWSITNTSLGEILPEDAAHEILATLHAVEEALTPGLKAEREALARRAARKQAFLALPDGVQ